MSITRWDPFREMMGLRQAMDRLFDDSFVRPSRLWSGLVGDHDVPLDVYETDNDVVVKASLPGVKTEDVDISIVGSTLTIKGETKAEEEVKKEGYLYQERRYGSFSRSVTLPSSVQPDKAEATFEQGVLTLKVPKAEAIKPKTIKIKAAVETAKK